LLNLTVILSHVAFTILSIGLVIVVAYGIWFGAENILSTRAKRHAAEHEAAIVPIVADANQQVWVHEHSGMYRNLHLNVQALVTDGQLPTEAEIQKWALWQSFHATANRGAINAGQELLDAVQPVDLLSHMRNVKRCLIVGSSDAGKTTLLKHIATERVQSSYVMVIDPHASPTSWPAEVIGRGSNHAEISRALDGLLALMEKRYDEIGKGKIREGEHRRLTVIVDEWMTIEEECKNAAHVFGRLIREARKAGIDTFVGSHSDRVSSLGLTGKGDLRDGLEIIRLHFNQWTGERTATVTIKHANGEKEVIPAILPGKFDGNVWTVDRPNLELPEPEPDEIEQRILAEYSPERSMRQITQAVFGEGKFGDHWNRKVYDVLNKYGILRE
jgi:GTPase SAR1 family protein